MRDARGKKDNGGKSVESRRDEGEKQGWWFRVHLTDFYDFLTSD
ncbi:hypothetical protein M892_22005 [Vibrio campbellii ATCC BAA-1116]|uniref:Uncharacterized protein n=1 Tax=Vibrio campbellii (strain ATCC BAA-1116) TaxID=2902295 RepID=A7N8G9_VIBC1|nr:hypothetical protein VIBHAR_05962 [Vibrio campbellii ATCC BAA-1116]AGU98533.1 hypothetical protein M892_22005 [Vibrio campbellii ATCC BAA-1116]